jgi:hypothetical protein
LKYFVVPAAIVVVLLAVALRSGTSARSAKNPQSAPAEEQWRAAEPEVGGEVAGPKPARATLAEGAPAEDGTYRSGPIIVAPDPGQQGQANPIAGVTVDLDFSTGALMIVIPQRIDTGSTTLRGSQRLWLAEDEEVTMELDPTPDDEVGLAVEVDWGTARGTWKDFRDWAGIARLPRNPFLFDVGLEFRFAVGGTRYTVDVEVRLAKEGESRVRVLDGSSGR